MPPTLAIVEQTPSIEFLHKMEFLKSQQLTFGLLQSGLSSRAKHGGTVFSAISGSIKDLTTVPGSYNHLGP